MKKLLEKYNEFIMYAIFGVLTTVINVITYYIFYNVIGVNNAVSTIIAWIFAVIFAFFTNKKWVFKSEKNDTKTLLYELSAFTICRLFTGGVDLGIMIVAVDILSLNSTIMKIASNILVIILNFIASKLVIFKKKAEK